MNYFLRYCLLFLLIMASQASFAAPNSAACEDFLASINKKPAHLEFVKCEPGRAEPGGVLRATYRVQGQHANSVEKYFIRHARMRKLKFYCCGWEPAMPVNAELSGVIKVDKEFYYISMAVETSINDRSGWKRIPWFDVEVTLHLDEP